MERLRQAAAQTATEEEALEVARLIRDTANRIRAGLWEPYPWQHPHRHPPGWVSLRAPGICDDRCYTLPPIEVPAQGTWLLYAGRGCGKTEAGAHYVNRHVQGPACDPRIKGGHKLLIIGPTQGDAVDACVEGVSGLKVINPAVRLLTHRGGTFVVWPNGARARILGASTPEDVERTRASGNNCVAEGTLVQTARGAVPVEEVTTSDLVWTRTGLRPVVRAECTGVRAVGHLQAAEAGVWLTAEHPVALAEGGWTEASEVQGNVLVWQEQQASSTTGSPGGSDLRATGRTVTTASYTDVSMSGRSDPFPRAGTFTTGTTTGATMPRPTSLPWIPRHTAPNTPMTETGTPRGAARLLQLVQTATRHARSAGPRSLRAAQRLRRGSAHQPAGMQALPHAHQSSACAACVAQGSPASAGPAPEPVPRPVVAGQRTRLARVYDLAVEGQHEFYAGGMLVGNCLIWLEEAAAMRRLEEVRAVSAPGLRVGVESGARPHYIASTTPKNRPEMQTISAAPDTIVTKGRTRDATRLPTDIRAALEARFGNTTLGRQELDAEELGDVEGALWVAERPDKVDGEPNRDERPGIENDRVKVADYGWRSHRPDAPPPTAAQLMHRVIVGVDPPGGRTEAGIVVFGTIGMHGYVLADLSKAGPPDTWARLAIAAYYDFGAEGIAAEHTYGGDMVHDVLHTRDPAIPIFKVPTKVGKRLRAEPVQGLYQQHRIHHVGVLPGVEGEQTTWVPDEGESPNRVDALVHAATFLMIRVGGGTTYVPQGRVPGR